MGSEMCIRDRFKTILSTVEGPKADDNHVPQFLITSLDYDSYVGQIAVGRLNNGKLNMNGSYSLCKVDEVRPNQKFSALYTFQGLKKVPVDEVESGDIIAFAGVDDISIGDTMSDNESPDPLQWVWRFICLLYTSPSPRDLSTSRMPSSA